MTHHSKNDLQVWVCMQIVWVFVVLWHSWPVGVHAFIWGNDRKEIMSLSHSLSCCLCGFSFREQGYPVCSHFLATSLSPCRCLTHFPVAFSHRCDFHRKKIHTTNTSSSVRPKWYVWEKQTPRVHFKLCAELNPIFSIFQMYTKCWKCWNADIFLHALSLPL